MTEASENIWMVKNNVEIDVDIGVRGTEREVVFEELDWAVEEVKEALRPEGNHE
jgi:uncharacterized protein YjfI (DUF2170 family)